MSTQITDHFTQEEFRCHDGTAYPDEWVADRLRPLCDALEAIRAELGGHAMTILSGYRTSTYNGSLRDADGSGTGVAKNSQHIVGRAADITVDGISPTDVYRAVMKLDKAGTIQIGGVGYYKGWVHVDVRPRPQDNHLATWVGPGVSSAPSLA